MISLILFLSTTVFIPSFSVLLVPFLLILREHFFLRKNVLFEKKQLFGFLIIGFSFLFITFLNVFLGPVIPNINDNSIMGDIPYGILILISFFVAKYINLKDLRFIQYFVLIEIIIGVFEYIAGVPTFFKNNTSVTELTDSGILYQNRVFGFSSNSSALALKIVYIATVSIMFIKINRSVSFIDKLVILFILVGLFVTFNRTAIISIFASVLILFGFKFKNLIILIIPVLIVIYMKWNTIFEQLTRGRGEIDLSGRDYIFNYFYNFWTENIVLGNVGTKLWWNASGSVWHAHNSYLEFLASNGLIVSIAFIVSCLLMFGRKIIIVLPILFFSLFQYGFLWGLSAYDILLAAIIFIYINQSKELSGSVSFK